LHAYIKQEWTLAFLNHLLFGFGCNVEH